MFYIHKIVYTIEALYELVNSIQNTKSSLKNWNSIWNAVWGSQKGQMPRIFGSWIETLSATSWKFQISPTQGENCLKETLICVNVYAAYQSKY